MAEGGAPLSCESFGAKNEKYVMLLIPEDSISRRHSFHEVGHASNCPKLHLETKRRNSSYPETQFHNMCATGTGIHDDDRILEIEEQRPSENGHHHKHHKHHHHKRHSNSAHKHHRRKSSARPEMHYGTKSKQPGKFDQTFFCNN